MATGGDVFVLDMDEPVKIDDLAKSMIRLMGLEVRDAKHPDGDIAIEYIGLRHGEKLHEELLLGENITPTEHPRILKSHEPCMPSGELAKVMEALRTAMDANDLQGHPRRADARRGRLSPGAATPARGPACQWRQRQGARSGQPHRAAGVKRQPADARPAAEAGGDGLARHDEGCEKDDPQRKSKLGCHGRKPAAQRVFDRQWALL